MRTERSMKVALARTWRRPVSVTERLLALFAIGLLLGLWLGQGPDRSRKEQLRALNERVHLLEIQRARYQEPVSSRKGATPRGGIPNADSPPDPAEYLSIRL